MFAKNTLQFSFLQLQYVIRNSATLHCTEQCIYILQLEITNKSTSTLPGLNRTGYRFFRSCLQSFELWFLTISLYSLKYVHNATYHIHLKNITIVHWYSLAFESLSLLTVTNSVYSPPETEITIYSRWQKLNISDKIASHAFTYDDDDDDVDNNECRW